MMRITAFMLALLLAAFTVACDSDTAPDPTGPDNVENPPPDDVERPDEMSPEDLREACEQALTVKADDPMSPELRHECNEKFPEIEQEARCRDFVVDQFEQNGVRARENPDVANCVDEFETLEEILDGDHPCDAEGPIADHCSCVDFAAHPDYSWLSTAVGDRYQCSTEFGTSECWLELQDDQDGEGRFCGARCGSLYTEVTSLQHIGGVAFEYTHPGDGVTRHCSPM